MLHRGGRIVLEILARTQHLHHGITSADRKRHQYHEKAKQKRISDPETRAEIQHSPPPDNRDGLDRS